jgi:hypothetical protein
LLQVAPVAHWNVQFPGPVHRFVHVEPVWQMNVQPPPLHDVSQTAPVSHVIVQPPPLHEGMHVVFGAHVNVQPPLKHPGVQVPDTHVQDPSVPQPVPASPPSPASVDASTAPSLVLVEPSLPESGFVVTSGDASVTLGASAAASEPASWLTADSSHAQTATSAATRTPCVRWREIIATPCNRIEPSTSRAPG